MIKKSRTLIFILSVCYQTLYCQTAASSYSLFGIGLTNHKGLIYNQSMGGLGISAGKPWILNNINPAMLPLNNFSTFEAGLYTEQRTQNTSELSQSNTTGGLNYLGFGFPIQSNKWTMAMGIIPFSSVSYNITTTTTVPGRDQATADYQFTGNGGINQAFLSSGWRIIPNFLYLGGRMSYTFGTITDETLITLSERAYRNELDTVGVAKTFEQSNYFRSSRYSDFLFDGGLYMKKKIGKETEASFGLIYEFGANINTVRNERIEIVRDVNPNLPDPPESPIFEDKKGLTFLPPQIGLGLSLAKEFKWTFGVDYYTRDWSNYTTQFGVQQPLTLQRDLILGGEFTPDFFSIKSYWKRVTYLFGFNYSKTPITINNQNIYDFGANFGLSLPVGSASLMNIGMKFGQMGTTSNGLVRENYLRINLGMTFNDRSFGWYRSLRKFD